MSVILGSPLVIEGYELTERLLKHSMDPDTPLPPVEVWAARCIHDNTVAILKFCRCAEAQGRPQLEYIQREGAILSKLAQIRIPRFLESFYTPQVVGFAMERVPGETLTQWVKRPPYGRLTYQPWPANYRAVMSMCCQIAETMGFVHGVGLVHADIKPANIIVTPLGDTYLIDFGIARPYRDEGDQLLADASQVTWFDGPIGTISYIAPELLRGQPALPCSDVYMLGIVMYELLCGQTPYQAEGLSIADYLLAMDDPEPIRASRDDIPADLAHLVMSCISIDPADRPKNGTLLAQALTVLSRE